MCFIHPFVFFYLLDFFFPLFIWSIFMHAVTLFTFHRKRCWAALFPKVVLNILTLHLTYNVSNNILLTLRKKSPNFEEQTLKCFYTFTRGVTTQSQHGCCWKLHRANSENWRWGMILSQTNYFQITGDPDQCSIFTGPAQSERCWLQHIGIPSLSADSP